MRCLTQSEGAPGLSASRLHAVLGAKGEEMDVFLFGRIQHHLGQLAPHVAARESAVLLRGARDEIIELQTRLDAMRQCFIDNTLRTTPSAKGTNIGKQIDEAVDRVVRNMKATPNVERRVRRERVDDVPSI